MIRRIRAPKNEEKVNVAAAATELRNNTYASGLHGSPHPATGTRVSAAMDRIARRGRAGMKKCGASAKVIRRVSPTRHAAGRNSTSAVAR
ncbi:hypothetical protein ABT236_24035 [Streptomyces sp. NPDC001523]|uniref:hypothetical protein n=1 Tax=Streptomyces sp. NPDC001523 TaxID=3154383 RepID=UPI00332A536F